jgi:hypothetical protein
LGFSIILFRVTFVAASKYLMKFEAAGSFELWQSFAKQQGVRNITNWEFCD